MGLFGLFRSGKRPSDPVRAGAAAGRASDVTAEQRFSTDRARLFDLGRTQQMQRMFATPADQRDAKWIGEFLDAVWHASVVVCDPPHFDGPDGFPYYRFNLPAENVPFDSQSLGNLAGQCCERQAGAAIFACPADPVSSPQFVFSMGMLDSMLRFDSPDGDPLDRSETEDDARLTSGVSARDMQRHDVRITKEDHRVIVGSPTVDYLPAYAARGLGRYMSLVWGLGEPRVAILVDGAMSPSRNLVIGRKRSSFASEAEISAEMRRLSWFLPSWRSLILMPEDWDLATLTPLSDLGG